MKRHFSTYCLICVVSLIAALVFSTCDLDLRPSLDGTLTLSPSSGQVGLTFTANYDGKDSNKIKKFIWTDGGPDNKYEGKIKLME